MVTAETTAISDDFYKKASILRLAQSKRVFLRIPLNLPLQRVFCSTCVFINV